MRTFITTVLFCHFLLVAGQNVPPAIQHMYDSKRDIKISDDFNATRENHAFDQSKWHYRQPTANRVGLATGSRYVEEKDGKLICYGRKDTRKAGAIISNQYRQYGWYAFR